MRVTVVGTGFIGGVLGRALAMSGYDVTFASRHPEVDAVAGQSGAQVTSVAEALASDAVVILALPGAAVGQLVADQGRALGGKLVIDATNQMGQTVPNARALLPPDVRYARAFNNLGGENMAEPVFADGQRADMFFSAPEQDRGTVEAVISAVGLRPVYLGEDQEALVDAFFQVWVTLAIKQGRGRRLAFKLLEA
ncbi:MAG: NAD(P)-binding domain-containing protein [Acidimicrobiales bacterium]|jgi:predicted dinucleotide-binding enzyme